MQKLLNLSQEGGHHPRFTLETLQSIGIPSNINKKRDKISADVEAAVTQARKADQKLKSMVIEYGKSK